MFGNFQFGQGMFGEVAPAAGGGVTVFVTGLEATGFIGQVTVVAAGEEIPLIALGGTPAEIKRRRFWQRRVSRSVTVFIKGLEATGALGTVTVITGSSVVVRGNAARAFIGIGTVRGHSKVFPRGLCATARVGRLNVRAIQNPTDEELILVALYD